MVGGTILLVAAASFLGVVISDSAFEEAVERQTEVPGSEQAADNAIQPVPAAMAIDSSGGAGSELRTMKLLLQPGDTMLGVLAKTGVTFGESYSASESFKKIVDPRTLRAGQEIDVKLREADNSESIHLVSLSFSPETDRLAIVQHQPDESFEARERPIEHAPQLIKAGGEIATSLYDAARDQEVPMPILLQAYQVLGHAVDFQRDVREGDTFVFGFEGFDDGNNGGLHPGNLVYASLTLGDRPLGFYRYTTIDGYTGFFDADGRSAETGLMKTPVDGGQLSSLFGKRNHPILGYARMHKGLDFAVPRGAQVLAAGDGIVVQRERNSSFGNYLRIQHEDGYATLYAHLSRFAERLAPGDRVRQGEVVGYAGATGLATGPNLHYEVLKQNEQVNPMSMDLPPRRVLRGEELTKFRRATAMLLTAVEPATARNGGLDETDVETSGGLTR